VRVSMATSAGATGRPNEDFGAVIAAEHRGTCDLTDPSAPAPRPWTRYRRTPLAVAFAAFQLATVLADVRLQARITGAARATATSVAGMATDLTVVAFYAAYGVVARAAGNAVAFALAAVAYLVVALGLVRLGAEVGKSVINRIKPRHLATVECGMAGHPEPTAGGDSGDDGSRADAARRGTQPTG
jgi:hypothetical protein